MRGLIVAVLLATACNNPQMNVAPPESNDRLQKTVSTIVDSTQISAIDIAGLTFASCLDGSYTCSSTRIQQCVGGSLQQVYDCATDAGNVLPTNTLDCATALTYDYVSEIVPFTGCRFRSPVCSTSATTGLVANFNNVDLRSLAGDGAPTCVSYPNACPTPTPSHSCSWMPGVYNDIDGVWLHFEDQAAGWDWFAQLPLDPAITAPGTSTSFQTYASSVPGVEVRLKKPGASCASWTGTIEYLSTVPNWRVRLNLTCANDASITFTTTINGRF